MIAQAGHLLGHLLANYLPSFYMLHLSGIEQAVMAPLLKGEFHLLQIVKLLYLFFTALASLLFTWTA